MNIAASLIALVLLLAFVSGCGSVASNSESFYQNTPRRPINWREYLTDRSNESCQQKPANGEIIARPLADQFT
jgi:hypothetical protein